MPKEISFSPAGLWTDPNPTQDAPRDGMLEASNVVFRRQGLAEPRRGFPTAAGVSDAVGIVGYQARRFFEVDGELHVWGFDPTFNLYSIYRLTGAGAPAAVSSDCEAACFARQLPATHVIGDGLAFTGIDGIKIVGGDTTRSAGVQRPTTPSLEGSVLGLTPIYAPDTTSAYRLAVVRQIGGLEYRSAPSTPFVWFYPGGVFPDLNARITVPSSIAPGLQAGDVLELYRTRIATPFTADPGDEMFLVTTKIVTAGVLAGLSGGGTTEMFDEVPDADLGAALYTNASQETISAANTPPPWACDIAEYGGSTWFANNREQRCIRVSLSELVARDAAGIPSATPPTVPPVALDDFWQREVTGLGLAPATSIRGVPASEAYGVRPGMIVLDQDTGEPAGGPSAPIYVTAVESNGGAEYNILVDGDLNPLGFPDTTFIVSDVIVIESVPFYPKQIITTGPGPFFLVRNTKEATELLAQSFEDGGYDVVVGSKNPGLLFVCRRDYSDEAISATGSANVETHGAEAYPIVSEAVEHPGRMHYSKYGQPESVPGINFLDVGNPTKAIVRIVGTRDALWVFKDDGLFRVSGRVSEFGAGGNWRVDPVDPALRLLAPDSAAVLHGRVYVWTNRGVVIVGDHGVTPISRGRIGDQLDEKEHVMRADMGSRSSSFGLANVVEDEYVLAVGFVNGSVAETVFVYNEKTDAWSSWDLAPSHMLFRENGRLLFAGDELEDGVFEETKNFNLADFHDGSIPINVTSSVTESDGRTHRVIFDAGSGWTPQVGDCIRQPVVVTAEGSFHVVEVITNTEVLVNLPDLPVGARTAMVSYECRLGWTNRSASDPTATKFWQDGNVWFKDAQGLHGLTVETHSDVTDQVYRDPRWKAPDVNEKDTPSGVRFFVPRPHARAHDLFVTASVRSAFAQWRLGALKVAYKGASRRVRREYGANHSGTGGGQGGVLDAP